ncbi:hypothetical protein [Thalassotalea mangrovi]|uniref:Uncharacterized protein n=1 Tax=Thalassotalea mangrovi TaxID=2572245 RepID=A0A4U1B423_9GAMM|nr:hypothetical protein [Thalassotalea mangrovi]TKB44663.1 hypothetical protein E8M12_11030 [Thalassotalea mangrovi]
MAREGLFAENAGAIFCDRLSSVMVMDDRYAENAWMPAWTLVCRKCLEHISDSIFGDNEEPSPEVTL